MCGIAAILTSDPGRELVGPLRRMQAALRHRGPDDEGLELVQLPGGARLGLAHTRLSILDPSAAGHQPMQDEVTGSWIVYNGEIYNHRGIRASLGGRRFRSGTDTETLLRLWDERGDASLEMLRGMFAMVIYDAARQQVCVARDRLGIKPLYASRTDSSTWVFASELRAVVASGLVSPTLDRRALRSYLAFGAVIAPWAMLEGVTSLMPGDVWTFDCRGQIEQWGVEGGDQRARSGGRESGREIRDRLSRHSRVEIGELGAKGPLEPRREIYWRPQFCSAAVKRPRHEIVEEIRNTLVEATELRMLADVPVGVFLSGGIDSSALVACLVHKGYRPRTFSIVFSDNEYDESQYSRDVASRFQTEHTELRMQPDDVLQSLSSAMAAYDQPSIDGVNTFFISRCVGQTGLKVALSGLGGDELFGGYPAFRLLARLSSPWQRAALHLVLRSLRVSSPGAVRTQKLAALLNGARTPLDRYGVCREVFTSSRIGALLDEVPNGQNMPFDCDLAESLLAQTESLDAVNAHGCLELALYMSNMLLRDTDQMSMAHGLEVRVPFLDHQLVDVLASTDGLEKLRPGRFGWQKSLLLEALPKPLPRTVFRRRKMGFVFPWERWLRRELRETVAEVLHDRTLWASLGMHSTAVRSVWEDFLANRPNVRYSDILCLLHLGVWAERNLAHGSVVVAKASSLSEICGVRTN